MAQFENSPVHSEVSVLRHVSGAGVMKFKSNLAGLSFYKSGFF